MGAWCPAGKLPAFVRLLDGWFPNLQYAARCGRIHAELVDTLFRYNGRPRMGRFMARLEALRRRATASPRVRARDVSSSSP
jgi:hypothetical protein